MAVTWVETQVLSSVATMWLIRLAYVRQSPRSGPVCRGRRLIN